MNIANLIAKHDRMERNKVIRRKLLYLATELEVAKASTIIYPIWCISDTDVFFINLVKRKYKAEVKSWQAQYGATLYNLEIKNPKKQEL